MSHGPSRNFRYYLKNAADDGQLVICRCTRCRRVVHFLAADLVTVLNPGRDAMDPPYPCSKCGRADSIQVYLRLPSTGDYGDLLVRRPGPIRRIQTWRTVKLGD